MLSVSEMETSGSGDGRSGPLGLCPVQISDERIAGWTNKKLSFKELEYI